MIGGTNDFNLISELGSANLLRVDVDCSWSIHDSLLNVCNHIKTVDFCILELGIVSLGEYS